MFKQLLQTTNEERKAILNELHSNETDLEEKVKQLQKWIEQSEHLPREDNINRITSCLLNCKMSLQTAKQCIEGYYSVRQQYSDFFDQLQPNTKKFYNAKQFTITVVMPKLSDLSRISIIKVTDVNGEAEDNDIYYFITLMIAELRICNDFFLSNIIIIDMEHYNIKNVLKMINSPFNYKIVHMLNAINLRISDIHFLHTPSFTSRLMPAVKTFLPSKIFDRIHLHETFESLYKFLSKDHLPSDYGGNEKSLIEIFEDWCDVLCKNEPFFQGLLQLKSKGKKQNEKYNLGITGMGIDGSFRKLNID